MRNVIFAFILVQSCFTQNLFAYKETVSLSQVSEEEQSATVLSASVGACSCDLTPGLCNYLCCCDTDCSEETRKAWFDANECSNSISASTESYCIDDHYLFQFTRKRGMTQFTDTLTGLLCVSYDSGDTGSSFLSVPSQFQQEEKTKFYQDFLDKTRLISYNYKFDQGYQEKTGKNYNQDDPIHIVQKLESVKRDNKFYIKAPGAYGECVKGQYIQFLKNIPVTECGHTFVSF